MKKSLKTLLDILFALIGALLAALLTVTEPFYALDSMLCDALYPQMNGTGDDIAIIAIDAQTLAEYGKLSEWSRERCAELAEYLYSGENQPAVLAFDLIFTGETDTGADERLVQACTGRNVVTASNLVYSGTTIYSDGSPSYSAWNVSMEEKPFAALDGVVETGFTNALVSPDGFVRSAQLWTDTQAGTRYSFASCIYRRYMLSRGEEAVFPAVNAQDQTLFGYSGKPGEFQRFSFSDVLSGKVDKRNFKDKIILVGAYATGLQDSFRTPADRDREMYGVEVNANIIRALMLGKTSLKAPVTLCALINAAVLFIYIFTARKMKMYPALLSLIWVIALDLAAGFILSRSGIFITLLYPLITAAAAALIIFAEKYINEILRKRGILKSFGKYLSPQVIAQLAKDEIYDFGLGVEKREVCVLFVDIRGFTAMSEVLSPEEMSQILNNYLGEVTECVFRHSGMLDKFIGDAAMAVFNAPTDQEDYLFEAVCAGLDIKKKGEALGQRILDEYDKDGALSKRLSENYGGKVGFGIGIHCGEAVVGNIGCDIRMDYTAIGDTVNTAARIEASAARGEVLISEKLYGLLEGRIEAELKGEQSFKNKASSLKIYSVKGVTK